MKKIYIILFFLIGIFVTTNSQNNNHLKNKEIMEKLNIDNIKDKFTNRQYLKDGKLYETKQFKTLREYCELKEDTLTTIIENYDGIYTKVTRKINSNFKNVKDYSKNNFLLEREITYFGGWSVKGLEIGTSKEYDENGNLIEEKDNDKNYPFSINMLIEKIKDSYDIDLSIYNQEQPVVVWRFYENAKWIYCVKILLSTDLMGPKRFIKMDGVTGEVISDKVVSLPIGDLISTNTKNEKTIEKLDFKNIKDKFTLYKQKIKDGKIYTYKDYKNTHLEYMEIINDTLIQMVDENELYHKATQKINSPFTNFKVYYKSNYQLAGETNKFYGFITGLGSWYEEDGSLIQIRDYDEKFAFSVEMLIDKMKTEYNIDLLIPEEKQRIGISRNINTASNWMYEIRIPFPNSPIKARVIKIDGATGELISDEIDSIYYNIK